MGFQPLDFLFTLNAFGLAFFSTPLLCLSYITVKISHSIWFKLISYLHPELQFVKDTTLRTLSDTHRNQGIIAVLLTVRGGCNLDAVRRHLQSTVFRTDKFGNILFPHLQQSLVAKFGTYAWQNVEDYDLTQNLLLAPFTYKGRIITELNIQECVSDIISKYLPAGVPPWQLVVIPSSEHQHYILLRLHHVLLSGGLKISDLLPIQRPQGSDIESPQSILCNVFKQPESIPALQERLTEDLTNLWNEFVSNYDPLEQTSLLKTTPGFFEYIAIVLITTVSALKEYSKGLGAIKTDPISRLKFAVTTAERESAKRKVNVSNLVRSIFVTIDPRNILTAIITYSWRGLISATVKMPIKIFNEFNALRTCISLKYCPYPYTLVGMIYNYVPLFFYAAKEVLYCLMCIYKAPRNIVEEIFSNQEILQTVTLCGRKVVAWSEPVNAEYVREIAKRTNVSVTEVVLATCSASFAQYFDHLRDVPPKEIALTARHVSSDYIFDNPDNAMGGILCLGLPVLELKQGSDLLDTVGKIKKNAMRVLDMQPLTYLLSILQTKHKMLSKLFPATFIGVFLRVLSVKYSVAFTEMTTMNQNVRQQTVWGQEVLSAIYWRPPQANISISLCVNHYADHMVMGVMSDAQLVPHHPLLARNFNDHLDDLARAAGVQ